MLHNEGTKICYGFPNRELFYCRLMEIRMRLNSLMEISMKNEKTETKKGIKSTVNTSLERS